MSHHWHVNERVDHRGNKVYIVRYMDWSLYRWRSKTFTDKAAAERFAKVVQGA